MSAKSEDKITFDGLRRFLTGIGFRSAAQLGNSIAFHHPESGTIVTLTMPQDGQEVRPADLLSILVRLEIQGLVEESTLEQFRSGKLPLAS